MVDVWSNGAYIANMCLGSNIEGSPIAVQRVILTRKSQVEVNLSDGLGPGAKPQVACLVVKGEVPDIDGTGTLEDLVGVPRDPAICMHHDLHLAFFLVSISSEIGTVFNIVMTQALKHNNPTDSSMNDSYMFVIVMS